MSVYRRRHDYIPRRRAWVGTVAAPVVATFIPRVMVI